MPSTKMFRDRVVSMEQTYEQGEKHLALLQALVREAMPDLEFKEYLLDHEHDNFVMVYSSPAGREKRVTWTRMVLYDAERIPAVVEDAQSAMRGKIVEFLRKRADRPVIEVTFRHLEDGWVDTPEPRKPKPRPQPQPGRRGGAAAESGRRGGPPAEAGRRGQAEPQRPARGGSPPPKAGPERGRPAAAGSPSAPGAGAPAGGEKAGRGRRRFRRRRRRGGGNRGGAAPGAPPAGTQGQ